MRQIRAVKTERELSTRNKETARERTDIAVGTHVRVQGDSQVEGTVEKLHHQPQFVDCLNIGYLLICDKVR